MSDTLTQRLLPAGGRWMNAGQIHDLAPGLLEKLGFADADSEPFYTFVGDTVIDGDLKLSMEAIDPDEDDIYTLLSERDVDQDGAYFLFLGDLTVNGQVDVPGEDPHFQLYVGGQLTTKFLCANDGLVLGDVHTDYQFVDDQSAFRVMGMTHARAIFLKSFASPTGPTAPGVIIAGGSGDPLKDHIAEPFSEMDFPLYKMLMALKQGGEVLHPSTARPPCG